MNTNPTPPPLSEEKLKSFLDLLASPEIAGIPLITARQFIENHISHLTQRLKEVEERVPGNDEYFSAIEHRAIELESQLTTANAKIAEKDAAIKELLGSCKQLGLSEINNVYQQGLEALSTTGSDYIPKSKAVEVVRECVCQLRNAQRRSRSEYASTTTELNTMKTFYDDTLTHAEQFLRDNQ